MTQEYNLLTLEEAKALSGRSTEELLEEGAAGALRFWAAVPSHATVQLLNENTGQRAEPAPMRIPNVLALEKHHCADVRRWGRAHVERSLVGAVAGPDSFRQIPPTDWTVDPADAGEGWRSQILVRRWSHWVVSLPPGSIPLEVPLACVRLLERDLVKRVDDLAVILDGPREPFESKLLESANLAAWIFWGNPGVIEGDKTTYPSTALIVEFLRSRHKGLSKSLAKAAASLMRPDFAGTGRPPENLADPRVKKKGR